jgi:hypothetical protein
MNCCNELGQCQQGKNCPAREKRCTNIIARDGLHIVNTDAMPGDWNHIFPMPVKKTMSIIVLIISTALIAACIFHF